MWMEPFADEESFPRKVGPYSSAGWDLDMALFRYEFHNYRHIKGVLAMAITFDGHPWRAAISNALSLTSVDSLKPENRWLFRKCAYTKVDGRVQYQDGRVEHPDGSVEHSDGSRVFEDGRVQYADGRIGRLDISVRLKDGRVQWIDSQFGWKDTPIPREVLGT
jgi:hypothetical protein